MHPHAPIAEIKLIIDNRYDPPETAMMTSHLMPGSIVQGHLLDAAININAMWRGAEQAQTEAFEKNKDRPPDLPPAPSTTEKPS